MLGLGLASSHSPLMWVPPADWTRIFDRMKPEVREHLPYTARLEIASLEMREGYHHRIHTAFARLREQVQAYRPDALIMIGDDQGDMFDLANNPTFSIYTGDEPIWGRDVRDWNVPPPQRKKVVFQNHPELAKHLLKGLIKRGFDMANVGKFDPRGAPERGVSHMVSNLVPEVDPAGEIPIVCVFLNEYYPPLPSAERCAQLGAAIPDILADRPERVAIYASGGLSHYPGEFNMGWIDRPLDEWILERLARNDLQALNHLFTFDSDTMRAGTGEVRAWISVAAAMNRPAKVLEYVPAHSTVTGCGFAYWPALESPAVEAAALAAGARA
ncbi:MAG: DODA-type extradiol aromatic ring-opening family dioxygenase [Dehalococcoidia bacterium]